MIEMVSKSLKPTQGGALILFGVALFGCVFMFGCHRQDKPIPSSLRVVDRDSGTPVQGARVLPFCGVPGDTNRFYTDERGIAALDLRWFFGYAQVRAHGYATTNITIRYTNAEVTVFLERAR